MLKSCKEYEMFLNEKNNCYWFVTAECLQYKEDKTKEEKLYNQVLIRLFEENQTKINLLIGMNYADVDNVKELQNYLSTNNTNQKEEKKRLQF